MLLKYMKTQVRVIRLLALFVAAAAAVHAADPSPSVDRVVFREGKVFGVSTGKTAVLEGDVTLPNAITVSTNGTFTVGKGKARLFKEGDTLNSDGTLTGSDGTLVPVFDHIAMKNGKSVLVKDGVSSPLATELALGNGARISPDGTLTGADGRRTKLLDGQIQRLDGQAIAATDTATLIKGKVVLQKDGSRIELRPAQSMIMSDGTKVFGDGTVIKKDGTKVTLVEGQVFTVEGVSTRPR
jgi:hypothetical protein